MIQNNDTDIKDADGFNKTNVLSNAEEQLIESFRSQHLSQMLVMLFTDLVGSSLLKKEIGDRGAKILEDKHKDFLLRALDEIRNAQAVRVEGDSYIFVFLKPSDAICFALRSQVLHREARIHDWPELPEFRVGIHLGTVIVEEGLRKLGPGEIGDIKGLQADTTARIMSLAQGGQILFSQAVSDDARQALKGVDIKGIGRLVWHSHGPYILKGRDEPVTICEVGEEGKTPFVKPPGNEKAEPFDYSDDISGWRPGADTTLPNTNWVMEKKLGQGGFGEVWLSHDRTQSSRKTVFKFCTIKNKARSLRRELNVFNYLSITEGRMPTGIVEVLGSHDEKAPYYIQLEYVPGGDLGQWITDKGKTAPLNVRLDLAIQMAQSLVRIHEAGIVHRDIKPSNFLLEPCKDPESTPVLKLSDFGIGQAALDAALSSRDEGTCLPGGGYTIHTKTFAGAAGAYFFIAPELILSPASTHGGLGTHATTAADIYSLGVTLYQLFAGDINSPPGIDLPDVNDPILREHIKACLSRYPEKRPTAEELIQRFREYSKPSEKIKVCKNCGSENNETANFCSNCGNPLKQEKTHAARMTDMEILRELEQEIGKKFRKVRFEKIWRLQTYVYEKGHIVGINLANLGIDFFPFTIPKLRHLRYLNLNANLLPELPPEIAELKKLEVLHCSENQLTELPPGIAELKCLRELHLKSNHLTEIPSKITKLESLRELILSENHLTRLPREITELKMNLYWESTAKGICVKDNPLEIPPKKIVRQGMDTVRNYFGSLSPGDKADVC
ncbi:Cyclase and kinase domains-containing protein [Desulfonema magnum]|uniref:Cyclase and kinase domains-containing protein n=1 Tax=Desulfonema magnum TaxID=45655 RepID=A0A975BHC3_9BACT|nr:Cyclase and kinase domains-containing protein [Desulfonema magnum]